MHVQLYRTALCIYGSRSVATAVADLTRVFFFAPVNNRERGARPFNSVTWKLKNVTVYIRHDMMKT
jgi:hypothetical protein